MINDLKQTLLAEGGRTQILVNGPAHQALIGGESCCIIAGPCSVESREGYLSIVEELAGMGVDMLRGGVFKPRTSPYSFAGLGTSGLSILEEARRNTGLPVVTEVMDVRDLEAVLQVADVVQVGSRNMYNYPLLRELGRMRKPVLLKRGLSATIEEWLLAAEYVLDQGNPSVILCERGIRTFEPMTRNTLDINAVAVAKELSHLPVIVDPSHATGRRDLVGPAARAAVAAGADGLMIEVHNHPEQALSDGGQSLIPLELQKVLATVHRLSEAIRGPLF